jgi:hypothetical protein
MDPNCIKVARIYRLGNTYDSREESGSVIEKNWDKKRTTSTCADSRHIDLLKAEKLGSNWEIYDFKNLRLR